jgi:hypothetical protein
LWAIVCVVWNFYNRKTASEVVRDTAYCVFRMNESAWRLCRHSGRESVSNVVRRRCHPWSWAGQQLLVQAIGVVHAWWWSAAYLSKGADWVGGKRVTGVGDGVTGTGSQLLWCGVEVTWQM